MLTRPRGLCLPGKMRTVKSSNESPSAMACVRPRPRLPGADQVISDKTSVGGLACAIDLGCRRVAMMDLTVRSRGDDSRPGDQATFPRPAPTRRPFPVVG